MFRSAISVGAVLALTAALLVTPAVSQAAGRGGFSGGRGGFHAGVGGFHTGVGGFHPSVGGFHSGVGGFRSGAIQSALPHFNSGVSRSFGNRPFNYSNRGYRGYGYGAGYYPYFNSGYAPYYSYPNSSYYYGSGGGYDPTDDGTYDSAAPSDSGYSSPAAWYYQTPGTTSSDTSEASAAPAEDIAHITLNVPADAVVWFNGHKTTSTGAVRTYQSPLLPSGQPFTYDLRVQWNENGQKVTQNREVSVSAGSSASLTFPERAAKSARR